MATFIPTSGDILDASADALVNPVNCVGVMGRGLARQFKEAYPKNFRAYQAVCTRKELRPGRLFVVDRGKTSTPRYLLNFPTKDHWKDPSRIEWIEAGLQALVREIRSRSIASIAIPPLGCGLGALKWPVVRELIQDLLAEVADLRVLLYEPI